MQASKGFSIIEYVVVIAVIGIISVAGWMMLNNGNTEDNDSPGKFEQKNTVNLYVGESIDSQFNTTYDFDGKPRVRSLYEPPEEDPAKIKILQRHVTGEGYSFEHPNSWGFRPTRMSYYNDFPNGDKVSYGVELSVDGNFPVVEIVRTGSSSCRPGEHQSVDQAMTFEVGEIRVSALNYCSKDHYVLYGKTSIGKDIYIVVNTGNLSESRIKELHDILKSIKGVASLQAGDANL